MSPAATYRRLSAVANALIRLTVPFDGGRSVRKISTPELALVKSRPCSRRSLPAAKTASPMIGAIESIGNGTVPVFVIAAPLPMKTLADRPLDETKSFPLFARTAIAVGSESNDPIRWGSDGTLSVNTSTDGSPSAAYSVVPIVASESTFGLLVTNVADVRLMSNRSNCAIPLLVAAYRYGAVSRMSLIVPPESMARKISSAPAGFRTRYKDELLPT